MKKYIILFILGIAMITLIGCSNREEDEARLIGYLDNAYGINSYTLRVDPEYKYRYIVNLKKYPKLEFMVAVQHEPFTSSYIWSNFDEVFTEYVIEQFTLSNDLGKDQIVFVDPDFAYEANISSIEELKISYDRLMNFINLASEKYPVLIETDVLNIRLDIRGIRFKGDVEDETMYVDLVEAKDGQLAIKSFDELYAELAPKVKNHAENPKEVLFSASDGRTFSMGSDTFEDCLYKCLELENPTEVDLKSIILEPEEVSGVYTLKSSNNYNDHITVEFQVKNMTDSACSLYDATLVKAVITGSDTLFVGDVSMDLQYDERREWIDPYKALKISSPKNEREAMEGVPYKNIKILFEEYEYWKGIERVTLTFQQ